VSLPDLSKASDSFKAANPHLFEIHHEPVVDPFPTKEEWKNEKQMQDFIETFLTEQGTAAIRSRMDRKTSNQCGTPDFLFAIKGQAVAFECKLPGRKLTEAQEKMIRKMTENGWRCYVINSYDEAKKRYFELQKISA